MDGGGTNVDEKDFLSHSYSLSLSHFFDAAFVSVTQINSLLLLILPFNIFSHSSREVGMKDRKIDAAAGEEEGEFVSDSLSLSLSFHLSHQHMPQVYFFHPARYQRSVKTR